MTAHAEAVAAHVAAVATHMAGVEESAASATVHAHHFELAATVHEKEQECLFLSPPKVGNATEGISIYP